MGNNDRANNERASDVVNPPLFQAFAWDMAPDSSHWRLLARNAEFLAICGVSSIWLPPVHKGYAGMRDAGYGVYDMYDLGEFDQKGAVPTKYGTKDEYLAAATALYTVGVFVVADVVLNHHTGGEAVETVYATLVDPGGHCRPIGEVEEIQAWMRHKFPGHGGAYPDFTWDWACFDGSDRDETHGISGVWLFEEEQWNENIDNEFSNYDYLMGCDVDVTNPKVQAELGRRGCWYVETVDIDGLRLDAVKHIGVDFFVDWLPELRKATGRALLVVGEYWSHDAGELKEYLEAVPSTSLFDVPLHFHLHAASNSNGDVDLSRLFEDTLVNANPTCVVTFVENHDTQPGQSLAPAVQLWFKPPVYAVILLWEAGTPYVFWGDLSGTPETGDLLAIVELFLLMTMRRALVHGPQHGAFDAPDTAGFVCEGDDVHPGSGLVAVLSDRLVGAKCLCVGVRHAGKEWVSVMGGHESVVVGDDDVVELSASDGGLSVYVPELAKPMLDSAKKYRLRMGSGNRSRRGLY